MTRPLLALLALALVGCSRPEPRSQGVRFHVRNDADLLVACERAQPGDTIALDPGIYGTGVTVPVGGLVFTSDTLRGRAR